MHRIQLMEWNAYDTMIRIWCIEYNALNHLLQIIEYNGENTMHLRHWVEYNECNIMHRITGQISILWLIQIPIYLGFKISPHTNKNVFEF